MVRAGGPQPPPRTLLRGAPAGAKFIPAWPPKHSLLIRGLRTYPLSLKCPHPSSQPTHSPSFPPNLDKTFTFPRKTSLSAQPTPLFSRPSLRTYELGFSNNDLFHVNCPVGVGRSPFYMGTHSAQRSPRDTRCVWIQRVSHISCRVCEQWGCVDLLPWRVKGCGIDFVLVGCSRIAKGGRW